MDAWKRNNTNLINKGRRRKFCNKNWLKLEENEFYTRNRNIEKLNSE